MVEIVYRYDPDVSINRFQPATGDEACRHLELGNLEFATLLDPNSGHAIDGSWVIPFDLEDVGINNAGGAPKQQPFAVVLGCSDARVPTELIFNRACNEMFVVRVAGNVLGREGLGSIDYAIEHLRDSLRLLVVLGHTQCGAVTAATDAFLKPTSYLGTAGNHPLRSIVNGVFPAVRLAADALMNVYGVEVISQPGYRKALIEASIVMNAAATASMLIPELTAAERERVKVVYGVYNLVTRRVGNPTSEKKIPGGAVHLAEPPVDAQGFVTFGDKLARSKEITDLLTAIN